jgi:hypothetical protein
MARSLLLAFSVAMLTIIAWLLPGIGTGSAARATASVPGSGAWPDAAGTAPGQRRGPPDLKALAGEQRPP